MTGSDQEQASPSDCAAELSAFHQEFADDLRSLLSELPLSPGMKVADAACGDGFFLSLLAEHVGTSGLVVGLDASLPALRHSKLAERQARIAGALERAPFVLGQLDAVFCCQSLFSLPDPVETLRGLARLVRPQGLVAVLENDSLHQLMLPWDPELELAIRAAEYAAFKEKSANPGKFYIGRHLPQCLRQAGLKASGFLTRTMDRVSPLRPAAEVFLIEHLRSLSGRVAPHLDQAARSQLCDLVENENARAWLREDGFTFSWLNVFAWGHKN